MKLFFFLSAKMIVAVVFFNTKVQNKNEKIIFKKL